MIWLVPEYEGNLPSGIGLRKVCLPLCGRLQSLA